MVEQYMNMLLDCLEKKNRLLDSLTALNKKQNILIQNEDFDLDVFDKCVEEKGTIIDNILKLDTGFQGVYDKIGETVSKDPASYRVQLEKMQKLITEVTEKSVSIQAQEERNKNLIENRFKRERGKIKSGRSQSRAAMDYYNSMNKLHYVDAQFWDKKS